MNNKWKLSSTSLSDAAFEVSDNFVPLPYFGHKTQQSIMPIIALADDEIIPLGTGFTVGQDGYLITAVHVIEEFGQIKVPRRDGNGFYKEFLLYALHITDKRHGPNNENYMGGLWPLYKVHYVPGFDIAVCSLRAALIDGKKYTFPSPKLSFAVPKVGEQILGFGYYKSSGQITGRTSKDGKRMANYSQETAFTRGKVTEVFYPQRDSNKIKWPSFETTARFESQMSGGPIFNEHGAVCGVICSSIEGLTEKDGYISYCSLIWPALGTMIEAKFLDDGPVEVVPFYEIVKRGSIPVDESFSSVQFVLNPDGTRTVSIPSDRK